MKNMDIRQKAAVISLENVDGYLILLPDQTIAKADSKSLKAFLTDFRNIDQNPLMKEGDQGTWEQNDPVLDRARIYAYITAYEELVLLDFTPFEKLFEKTRSEYILIREYAKRHGKSIEQVKVFCQQGRIQGAMKYFDRVWAIPEDAPYPQDSRMIANGKYIGMRNRNR